MESYSFLSLVKISKTSILSRDLPDPSGFYLPNIGLFFPELAADIFVRVCFECLRFLILFSVSSECLKPSNDPAVFKIIYSGFNESI